MIAKAAEAMNATPAARPSWPSIRLTELSMPMMKNKDTSPAPIENESSASMPVKRRKPTATMTTAATICTTSFGRAAKLRVSSMSPSATTSAVAGSALKMTLG